MGESVRIVVLDYYMSPPIPGLDVTYSEFRASSINQVPIIRCFGSTQKGEKICVHIHGVFPYLYIPYDGSGNAEDLMHKIAASIDRAVNISLNQGSSFTQHVYKIALVSGIPMYGFHPKKHQFFKIFLYNPMLISKVATLLLNHSILDQVFQPHETHLNFTLQFMIDYNLHGMSDMNIYELKYRVNPDSRNNDPDKVMLPVTIEKITTCFLEADVNAENILNRQEILDGKLGINPGIAALWEDEKQRRRNKNENSQLGQFLELKNMECPPTKTHVIFQKSLAEKLAASSTDSNIPRNNLNNSVYPAETPNDMDIQNASLIDIHTPSSYELSLDDTVNMSCRENLDNTLSQSNLNVTMDDDANNFLQLLEELVDEQINEKEEDSILSQVLKDDEQTEDVGEDFLDLSMPLDAVTTPRKTFSKIDFDKSDEDDDDDNDVNHFDITIIPQFDGQLDSIDKHKIKTDGIMTRSKYRKYLERLKKEEALTNDRNTKISKSPVANRPVAGDSQKLDRFHLESLQKTVKRKCMFINCDGTADSISDDELKTTRKPKRRKVGSSHYASLPISITKSPIVQKVPLDTGLSEKSIGISENNNPSNTIDKINQNTVHSKSDVSFKRKLNFDKETSLNTTQLEEFLTCSYSRKLRTEIKESASPTEKNVSNSVNAGHFDKMTEKSQCSVTIIPQNIDTTNSDSDIFSEDEDVKKSFFKSHSSVAEKYDQHFKYHAKEGCSTILTQDNILDVKNSNPTDLSGRTASDTGSDLTPYQKLRPDVENNCNQLFSRADANSQSKENLTPYQELNSLQMKATITDEFKTITPLVKAPSRLLIEESLNDHKIPQNYFIQPFYSDANDYTGAVEIGHDTLRIPSKSSCHYPEFESVSCALNDCRKYFTENISSLIWNPNNLKNLKFSHCSNRNITIRPIKKPPSVKEVLQWLESNSESMGDPSSTAVNNIKSKICIPTSPGHDEEELELSLSITPCTPESTKAQFESSKPTTPSPINSQDSSPVLEHRKKRCKKKDKRLVLRDSLFLSSETNRSGEITGNTLNNTFGFNKSVQNLQAARVVMEHQFLTTMVMELHTRTRGDFKPDPEYDPICAIFYSVFNDEPENVARKTRVKGAVVLNTLPSNNTKSDRHFLNGLGINCDIIYAETEEAVITNFLSVIKLWDPDIFAGYEIQMLSWGYLVERSFVLSINIIPLLSRSSINKFGQNKQRSSVHQIETEITGRIVLDVWRVMRHEIALQSYTFESIVYHILHRRLPMFPFKNLTSWWDHTNPYRHRVVKYYLIRVDTVIELFKKLDFLNRTSELARLFGIQFYEVLSRGSQFRVESMMLRLAKPLNYVPVSPSTQQRARMRAPEYIALVMEPESKLYNDPIIVLDFQSLYPSIIIAYNYCFTTCVGRVNCLGTNYPFEFGATQLKVSRRVVEKLSKRNLLNFSPCGVGFVKQKVRQGILPRMLTEILDTRLMVKNSMKENKGDDNLQKVLHNRQLGLKLIANVTFGYTSANFSGRMCCVDVGDSIISKARETLQRAIAMVETKAEWGARVVYGDTDSLFVMVTGKSREEAFEVGKKIADAVTADNPDPIKLKLEKVYHPCILQTKKRYVGYMYESAEQKEPVYDAKGIETVRRDGCLAVSKMLQKCLTILFETKDVSLIKKYVLRQFNKIQMGRASIQDLTFAKEYRGAGGYKPGACVPALELARKWKAVDRRGEPRSGERVPYIIVNGPPGLPLIRLVKSPRDLLFDNSLRPNSLYYITKVIIPPINRCLLLIGADVNIWFNQMPRKNTQYLPNSSPVVKSTISQYFISKICASCSLPTQDGLCDRCCRKVNVTALTLSEKLKKWEENYYNTNLICNTCTGHLNEVSCISLDCSVLYRRTQTYNDLQQSSYVRDILNRTDIFLENDIFQD